MARTVEIGLRYFPMDTGIFSDRKIRKLLKTFGAKGYLIYNFVLCAIYQDKGYYVQCDDDFLFDIADSLSLEENLVREVINFCVNNVLFNERVFNVEKVLTSAGIQKRYLEVKSRSTVSINEKYKINVTEKTINVTEKLINDAIIPQKKSKVKKSKENKKELCFDFVELVYKPTFMRFIEFRKQMKKPFITQDGVEMCYKKLIELSNNNAQIAMKIVEQSISNE